MANKVNAITGIVLEHLNRPLIVAALNRLGEEFANPPDDDNAEQLSTSLFMYYTTALPLKDQIRCQKCKGIGDINEDTCSYCGHDEGDPVEVVQKTEQPNPKEAPVTTTETATPKKENGATRTAKAAAALVVDDTKPSSMIRAERDLDQAVDGVRKAMTDAAFSGWKLGVLIGEIKNGNLWKLRTVKDDKTGKEKARYQTFDAFCINELQMTPRSANNWATVAANFSEDQVKTVGSSKLQLILQAPPEARPAIQKMAEDNVPAREIKKHVKKARKESKTTETTRTSAATAANEKKASAKTITVANVLGSKNIKLYKRPASLKGVDFDKGVDKDGAALPRAKKLADEPCGYEELENGVTQFYAIMESASGELVLKVMRKREE